MSETLTLTTCRDVRQARRIARALVRGRLAACVNVVPGVASIYAWKGRVEEAREALLLVKSTSARAKAVEARIRELHGYEVPEVVTLRIDGGSAAYLRWVRESVR